MKPASPATLVDVDRYPLEDLDSRDGQAFLASCQSGLEEQSICVLEGFLNPRTVAGMVRETSALIPLGYYYDRPRTSYEGNDYVDRTWPAGHPRTIEHINRYRQVLNYQIPNDSLVRSVFHWPALTEFVRRMFGFDTLYTSACPHLALTLQIAHEGDSNGWHFDSNNGNITLLIQAPDSGGAFEYVPDLRADHDEHYDDVRAFFESPGKRVRRTDIRPGTLVLFNGKYALHRVSPVGPTKRPRIIAIFSYDKRPDQLFSRDYIEMVRSFRQDTPTG
ncbi:MAG: phytanoyl-CoA dioxygenase family protein [Gemmatimonadetes bacterium]|nr:phytanoyl-CoA dioxygenase family protein [Gemmatimonadota bacterium]MYA78224.1 phytanoyl-CoA dioxygenase family protein [Gemmatimonadota bacterium]MYG15166.1 phytanoyl-CoA dioxygenase family protein [Gemmatimonadota bacterium]MYH20426.1 phytanoyl-CoA dioxygenase family protein [Gemmatimonadota bacterium]MYK99261.1 phytanoyl-CoA dioxygenase family protein [Gemmatimonadota bacterium]